MKLPVSQKNMHTPYSVEDLSNLGDLLCGVFFGLIGDNPFGRLDFDVQGHSSISKRIAKSRGNIHDGSRRIPTEFLKKNGFRKPKERTAASGVVASFVSTPCLTAPEDSKDHRPSERGLYLSARHVGTSKRVVISSQRPAGRILVPIVHFHKE